VQAKPREVEVQRFELIGRDGDRLRLLVECGSGTYVRSLVRDLGEKLGCGAHVTMLRRLWVEPFVEPRMHTLDELIRLAESDPAALDALLLPLEQGLAGYPQARLEAGQATRLRQGQAVEWQGPDGPCVAVDAEGRAVALAEAGGVTCAPRAGSMFRRTARKTRESCYGLLAGWLLARFDAGSGVVGVPRCHSASRIDGAAHHRCPNRGTISGFHEQTP
jgi:tRNA U55 pseudouridine synthase TruB